MANGFFSKERINVGGDYNRWTMRVTGVIPQGVLTLGMVTPLTRTVWGPRF